MFCFLDFEHYKETGRNNLLRKKPGLTEVFNGRNLGSKLPRFLPLKLPNFIAKNLSKNLKKRFPKELK